jgi:hypothetical protein
MTIPVLLFLLLGGTNVIKIDEVSLVKRRNYVMLKSTEFVTECAWAGTDQLWVHQSSLKCILA